MPATTMTYGSYSFEPVPLITVSKELIKSGDGTPLNELTKVTLSGIAISSSHFTGTNNLVELKNNIDEIRDAFKTDGLLFLIQYGGTDIMRAYPRVLSISFNESSNNWDSTAPFTIELEFPTEVNEDNNYSNITDASEEWSIEILEDYSQHTETLTGGTADALPYTMRLSHNVSAQGFRSYVSGTPTSGVLSKQGWEEAKDYVDARIGYNSAYVSSGLSGVFNISPSNLGRFNHVRSNNVDVLGGNYSVSENWLLLSTGLSGLAGDALEDYTVTVRTEQANPITTVSIEGTVQGLETVNYGSSPGDFTITKEKYASALEYWNVVKNRIYARANTAAGSLSRSLLTTPNITSLAHNKGKGTISYSYEYDNALCFLMNGNNALSGLILDEIVTINDNNPADVFATIPVLGRAAGPILQEISTVTERTRDVSVEILVTPTSLCTMTGWLNMKALVQSGVNANILCPLEADLTGNYSQVFKNTDTESWVPQQGRYTRQIGWTYADCSGSGSTSIC